MSLASKVKWEAYLQPQSCCEKSPSTRSGTKEKLKDCCYDRPSKNDPETEPHPPGGVAAAFLLKPQERDFPGGSMAKTPCLPCRGSKFNPWSGNYDPIGFTVLLKKLIIIITTIWCCQKSQDLESSRSAWLSGSWAREIRPWASVV